eukprot:Blabericola_migrator_1__5323@NODE_272_length_10504_cov_138_380473_g227_i0_p3_GENE_NODE_272_length_10504_cov_138_380473_g227_i0NODE_272_length_10504_cov_138_380473_g227_i0_p3_ORF_typecomplete_len293_score58_94_NODE_272_length_10504_cov_138_380473_g227_i06591537
MNEDILEAIVAIQKQQQRCLKFITHILTTSKSSDDVGHTTAHTTGHTNVQSRRRRKDMTYLELELLKACESKHTYHTLCQWINKEEQPFILCHKRKLPLLAQRLTDIQPEQQEILDPFTVVPTQIIQPDDEIEIADDIAERFHAVLFVKLFLFILLFDLDFEYLTILVVIFFLHINGFFDPVLHFWRRRAAQNDNRRNEPLERVLRNLEIRRNVEREVQVANEALEGLRLQSPIGERPISAESDLTQPSSPDTPETHTPTQPSQIAKVLYQTIGMFFGTLLPWWKPDQQYLS